MSKRFLGEAQRRSEGGVTRFDEGVEFGNHQPRGAGQMIRDAMEGPWYVVRDQFCSYDIDDEEAHVWTLSRSRTELRADLRRRARACRRSQPQALNSSATA